MSVLQPLSTLLNYILIALTLVIKVPQILTMLKNKSVYGLSYLGNNLQFLMSSLTLAYGLHSQFSFWIYGENVFISIQNLIIISIFFQYSLKKQIAQMTLIFAINFVICSIFILQLAPSWCQQLSIWLQLLVFILARGSQVLNNFKYKTTQNLSIKTVGITLFCNFARTFTILIEEPQSLGYLMNYLIPIFVNGTILAQILYYNNKNKQNNENINKKQ